jgi:hypothetical protein
VAWLGLKEGEDYGSLIDLVGLSRVWNPKFNSWSVFGLDHVATCWLGQDHALREGESHNAAVSLPHHHPTVSYSLRRTTVHHRSKVLSKSSTHS